MGRAVQLQYCVAESRQEDIHPSSIAVELNVMNDTSFHSSATEQSQCETLWVSAIFYSRVYYTEDGVSTTEGVRSVRPPKNKHELVDPTEIL